MSKNRLESFFEAIDVVVDQMLSMNLALVNKADKGQTFVNFSQIQHNVLLVIGMCQSDDRRRFFVKFASSVFFVNTIDACHIDQYIYQFRANLVVLHIYRRWVRCDVDLRDHVKKESLLDFGATDKSVHHLWDKGHLREKFLDHFGKGHIDRVIVDWGQLESELDGLSELLEQTAHIALDGVEALNLLVIIHEHVWVHLVDKHLVADVALYTTSLLDYLVQLLASAFIVSIVSINYIDKGTAVLNVLSRVAFEDKVAGEVNDTKLDVIIVADRL